MSAKKRKAKMGRPPWISPELKRTRILRVRLTEAEFQKLMAEARRTGLPVSVLMMTPWRDKWEKG